MRKLNRSLHVTTCERGKAIACVHPYPRASRPRTGRHDSVADSVPPDAIDVRTGPAVAVPAPSLGSDLCDQRRTRHHQPNGFLPAANHRKDSWIPSIRKTRGDGLAGKRTQTGRGPQFAQIRWLSPYSMLLGYGFLIGHVARTVNCCSSPMKRHPPRVFL